MEPPSASIELSYGRQAPAWRRRRYWIYAALVIAALLCGYFIRRQLSQWYYLWSYRREAARWYANALTWSEPPTKLKYTENPADAPATGFMRAYSTSGSGKRIGFATFGQSPVERLPLFNGTGQPILAGSPDEIMLFMHERTTPGGLNRLIAIRNPHFDLTSPATQPMLGLDIQQIALLKKDYRILIGNWRKIDMTGIVAPGEIRLYAGQVDPNDASKFSIPFEARGRRGWIDAQFVDGEPHSRDPALAKYEAEINAHVVLTIRMGSPSAAQSTTQPAP